MKRALLAGLALLGAVLGEPQTAVAQAAPGPKPIAVAIGYLGRAEEPRTPLSFLDPVIGDDGVQGARLGVADNNGTGRLIGIAFTLNEVMLAPDEDALAGLRRLAAAGVGMVVVDLELADLLKIADAKESAAMLLFNARASDDQLRNESCRRNVLHTALGRAEKADALAQYLVARRWKNWFLVVGRSPADKAYAQAIKRAAGRFGAKLVGEKEWTFDAGARRTDTGHFNAQQEIPSFTQVAEHDVLIVADESDEFGELLLYHTHLPRPVAGTQGLIATAWHRGHEQWGATQFHNRFERQAKRWMTERDYAAWIAARSVGEAASRIRAGDPTAIAAYMRGPDFILAAFKGVGVNYREWNGQLRQPVLVAGPRMLLSVSPQKGFLHQFSELDTLGFDRPESRCKPRP
jgi:ABC transporter substrate binding protein (PQQ-dependent alcohol dehydrogenase system)